MEEKKKRLSLFEILNGTNKNNDNEDDERNHSRNISYFFTLLWRNISRIFALNIMFVLGNFPVFFLFIAMSGIVSEQGSAAESTLFSQLFGAMKLTEASPALSALFGMYGLKQTVNIMTWKTYLFFGIGALTALTYGPVTCAVVRTMRNIVWGKPVFMLSDAWDTVKANWLNSIILGIFDLAVIGIIIYDIISFYYNLGNFFFNCCFWFAIFIAFAYFFMRMYIFPILITFELNIFKVIKNSFVFAFLGIKRNILALIAIALIVFLNYALFLTKYTFGLGIILPFVLTTGIIMFILTYAAWPKIKEVMVDPYFAPDGTPRKNETQPEEKEAK